MNQETIIQMAREAGLAEVTDTNQKLREALQLIAWSNDSKWQADCARQALALPTADHLPDAGEMVADHLPNAGNMTNGLTQSETDAIASVSGLTAAPVGEHELPPLPVTSYQLYYQWSDDEDGCGGSEVVDGDAYTADQMRAYARSALSAGDAVDVQRTPLTDEQIVEAITDCGKEDHTKEGWIWRTRIKWARAIEQAHGIDAAMRKDKL